MAKVLSVIAPYPTLMLMGAKTIETRKYPTRYRGEIYIHVSKRNVPKEWRKLPCYQMACEYTDDFQYGYIVLKATLVDCYQMTEENIRLVSEMERNCGFWEPGRYAWVLADITPIDPIEAKGHQTIWNIDLERR